MPDIFLSYSREDQSTALRFAEGLRREGFEVWWDQALQAGDAFDKATETALEESRAVVVLWSKQSVDSRWVRAEATQAQQAQKLVPVTIEQCKRPIMFELTHTADLSHWKGAPEDASWRTLVGGLHRLVKKAGGVDAASAPPTSRSATKRMSGPVAWIALAAAAIVVVAAGWALTRSRWPVTGLSGQVAGQPADSDACQSVAVMPFANLTGDASKDYMGDGMAEELLNLLVKVPGLTVPSRTSSFAYKGRNVEMREIAADLNVCSVLEGSVRSAGETIRITAQLIDARADRHIWSQTYTRQFTDVFKLQDEIAQQIVIAFRQSLGANVSDLKSRPAPTQDMVAYDLFLRAGESVGRSTQQGYRDAVSHLQQAVARAPDFANAWAFLALAMFSSDGSSLTDIEHAARRANELAPGSGDAILAGLETRKGNLAAAMALAQKVETSPNDDGIRNGYAYAVLWPAGKLARAEFFLKDALRINPKNRLVQINLAWIYSSMGRDDEALQLAEHVRALKLPIADARLAQFQVSAWTRAGRYAEAEPQALRIMEPQIRAAGGEAALKQFYAALADPARRKEAITALDGVHRRLPPDSWRSEIDFQSWYAQLGDLDRAYAAADKIRAQFRKEGKVPAAGWSWLWSRELEPFRADPRFQPYAASIGIMDFWNRFGPPDDCTLEQGKLTCH
jgi:TolB-like protein/Flp pilus assembly protein TadD